MSVNKQIVKVVSMETYIQRGGGSLNTHATSVFVGV